MDRLVAMEAFVRVADAGSFSGAARAWGRSKAAVSKYVAALEEHLGVALLRRTTRSLSLTDEGVAYHARCSALLAELESLESEVRTDRLDPRGVLRVTAPPGLVDPHLELMTASFVARYPAVTLDIDLTHRMVDLVEEGFDLAIRVTDPQDASFIVRRLAPAPIVLVASPNYLARHGTPERPEDLAAHACLVDTNFRDRHHWRFEVDGRARTVDVDGAIRVNSPLVVRELACRGHGIALVPRFVVEEALADGRLVTVLDGAPALSWSIYAVYPRRRHVSARVRCYVEHLAEGLPGRLGGAGPGRAVRRQLRA